MSETIAVADSIPALYQERLGERPERVSTYIKIGGAWRGITQGQNLERVRRIASGLLALGIARGDRVAVIASTRYEWVCVDYAILHCGAVTIGVYPSSPPDAMRYLLEHGEARVVFVEDAALAERILGFELPALEQVVLFDGVLEGRALTLGQLEDRASELEAGAFEERWRSVGHDDLATVVYTSGTTGPPKGAMLSHGNILHVIASVASLFPTSDEESAVVFLPMAHSLQRVGCYAGLQTGGSGAFAESIDKLIENFREIKPTVQVSVPRIWERAYSKILRGVEEAAPHRRALFRWALGVGRRAAPFRKRGASLPLRLRLPFALAEKLVFKRIRAKMFGERIRFLTSGGAPISIEILEFFYALGLLIIEGYGLTETAAPATINRLEDFRFGSVGKPIPGVALKIAADGEVLLKGPGIFQGYAKNPEATSAAFTEDGWFRSGDIGRVDGDGFLYITDRKKNIIVTANGHNIAPQNIENLFKNAPLISQALVHGDRRKFVSALFTLDPDELTEREGLRDLSSAAKAPRIRDEVEKLVDKVNLNLPPHERVIKWELVADEWTEANRALTPTMKLKRRVLEERYRETLDAFYAE